MVGLSSFLIVVLCIVGAVIGFKLTGKFLVAFLFMIVAVLIGKSVQPAFIVLCDKINKRLFPKPEVKPFFEEGLTPTEDYVVHPAALGYRVLCMTEDTRCNSQNKRYYDEMVDYALTKLSEQYPLFDLRLKAARRRGSGVQYAWSLCGQDGELMKKCVKAWFASQGCYLMKDHQKLKDLFLIDGELTKKDGSYLPFTVMVLFDSSLPVTLPKNKPEETPADAPVAEASESPADSPEPAQEQ